jgi:hypothetical protein
MTRITLDHCVIHVSDWDKAKCVLCRTSWGPRLIPFGNGYQFRWGEQQLNIHGPNQPGTPVAKLPVMPGGSDLCFRWHGPIETAIEHSAGQRGDNRGRPGSSATAQRARGQASISAIRTVVVPVR